MFQVRKDGFKDNPSVAEELDLVEEEDQFTHMITLDDATSGEEILNVFKVFISPSFLSVSLSYVYTDRAQGR